mmetsp:Transcript_1972/g.3053  ORF Transcript_1972/g.3053 Transcript_1972/m.3053 type:complete len:439 (-) Transcript_1972:105-1421(-)|eukprot:CAMPEP_0201513932 /NCGR_PEP_ID=MMETSP0161_2-20130828/5890_1 /ASSEMBLY_ACC=CAM_ASM_000251 /TAXON_ID=180227 /ORGANISM="Neoparamoeba aestuarina, Strain SoJaBio B1-5/56/2" /LENGTH=438 /DNA_ID=CAMNT_0047910327 /DNA_START=84 /DNA_END=1400 /DNA_ORIENTATION=+
MAEHHTFPLLEEETIQAVSVEYAELGDGDKLRSIMDEFGMVIVKNVVSSEEAKELERLFGQDLASLIDTKALLSSCPSSENLVKKVEQCVSGEGDDDLSALLPEVWPTGTRIGGRSFAIRSGIPQGRYAWGCRNKQSIRKVFSSLHQLKDEDLCVGLDTAFYTNPSLAASEESSQLWPHADQNKAIPDSGDWDIYQSILYVQGSDAEKGLSTTIIWPKSHKEHFSELMDDDGIKKLTAHYAPITRMSNRERAALLDTQYLKEGRRIPVPAGGLLVWSSRTIHQGHAGGRRLAMPVCWEPRDRRPEAILRRKIRMLLMGFASTHWAALGNTHPHQPFSHKALEGSENVEDLKAWVEYVEGVLGASAGSPIEHRAFDATHLPCLPRIVPGCLLKDKMEEFKELEEKCAADEKSGFHWVDKNQELSTRMRAVFEEHCIAAL